MRPANVFLSYFVLIITTLLSTNGLHAAQAKFSLIPTTVTTVRLPPNRSATVIYKVTNHTKLARTLTMVPIFGVMQNISGKNLCDNPFILLPQSSCLLSLPIDGSLLPPQGMHIMPQVCKTKAVGNNNPDPFLCSQTAKPAHSLHISSDNLSGQGAGKFLILSDLHYNSLAPNQNYPATTEDPNERMLDNFIEKAVAAVNTGGPPDFILVLGDFVAHNIVPSPCNKSCVLATIAHPLEKIWSAQNGALKNIPIFAMIGNNDSYLGDYQISSSDGFLNDAGNLFAGYALPDGSASDKADFAKNFTANYGSYITAILPTCAMDNPQLCKKIIMLNTVPFSNKTDKLRCNGTLVNCAVFRQKVVDFINNQIVGGLPALVGMHIADSPDYGWDITSSPQLSKSTSLFSLCSAKNANCVKQVWAGHWHMFTPPPGIPTYPGASANVNTMLSPSITQRNGVAPGFLLVSYDRASGNRTGLAWYSIADYDNSLAGKPLSTSLNFSVRTY